MGLRILQAPRGDGQAAAFWRAYQALRRRIGLFMALPPESDNEMILACRVWEIGKSAAPVD
jgi:hypothetical protein